MSLLFNILSRLVIIFLPRSKHLLISWLQSPSAVILEPKKIKSDTVSTVSPSISHEVMGPDALIFVSCFVVASFSLSLKNINKPSLVAQRVKCLPATRETWVRSLGQEDHLKKEMATHSNTLAWRIPWMEEPGGLQFTGSQRIRHD